MTRQEQKEERRKKILFTALNLFVKKGYHDTKIADIAEAASMSTGLLFHYFESKEALLVALIGMGVEGTKMASDDEIKDPDMFLYKFLEQLFDYANSQPWIFQMFVLMGQARRAGMPEEARKLALSVDTISNSSRLIEAGQQMGKFKEGDPMLMSTCFWAAVQGIMEEIAFSEKTQTPAPEWIMGIIRK